MTTQPLIFHIILTSVASLDVVDLVWTVVASSVPRVGSVVPGGVVVITGGVSPGAANNE